MAPTWRFERPVATIMPSAIAALPLRSMVTMSSALASSRWLRIEARRAFFVLRFGADFTATARLGAPVFFFGAVRVDVLFNKAVLHRDCVSALVGLRHP